MTREERRREFIRASTPKDPAEMGPKDLESSDDE